MEVTVQDILNLAIDGEIMVEVCKEDGCCDDYTYIDGGNGIHLNRPIDAIFAVGNKIYVRIEV